jgi:hypothetical protein
MGSAPSALFMLAFGIVPLIGLVMVSVGMKHGRKASALLDSGVLTTGRFVGREETSSSINDKPVYRYLFDFTATDGSTYRAEARTHVESTYSHPWQPLLYDPRNPGLSVLWEDLVWRPKTDERGEFQSRGLPRTLLTLLLPVSMTALNTLAVIGRLKGL